jgi:DNA-binding NarL/FixJ family response regulator
MQVTSVVIADGAASFDPAIVQSDELNGVIISLDLPVRSDLSIIRMLRTSEYQGPLMLLCAHYDLPVLDELVEYQVSGIVSSESSLEELEAALYAVLDQQPETLTRQYLKMARTIVRLPTPETLTRRELEILRLVATGLTDG